MPYYVYILQSLSSHRYYCGYSRDVQRRLREHNDPNYRLSRTTKVFAGPWNLVWSRQLTSRAEAMKLEKQIKKRGISRFLEHVQSAESRSRRD